MPLWYQNLRSALLLVQSIIGVLIFFYKLKRRKGFWLRFLAGLALGGALCHVFQSLFYVPGSTPLAVATHAMTSCIVYSILIALVFFCFDETIWTVLFASASGYFAQDIAGSFKQLVKQIPGIVIAAQDKTGIIGLDLFCYGSIFFLLYILFRPYTQEREEDFEHKSKAIFSLVAMLLCIGMARLTQDNPGRNTLSIVSESIYSIIADALILMVQFGIMERAKLSSHIDIMRELVHQQHMQYEASKESVQLINEKYHDLKHLLTDFQGVVPGEQLRRLRQSIEHYDIQMHTGNEVLDVLLTQSMNLCVQRDITLTCSIGQTDFGFVEELDLYTLVHNALHNAINAVTALPPERERFIFLSSSSEGNMLTLHVENSCGSDIVFKDGLPQSRGDLKVHGFGMKSMLRTAEKYDGTITAKAEDGLFFLDILLLNSES